MNSVRNWSAIFIGTCIYGATLNWPAGLAAWMFTIVVTYNWSKAT